MKHNTITLVGMDAHSEHISLCITTWAHGSDPVVKKAIGTTLESLETTYKKHVPTTYYRKLRSIFFGYRNAVKNATRCSNRL